MKKNIKRSTIFGFGLLFFFPLLLWADVDSNIYYNNGHFGTGLSTPSARFHIFDDQPTGSVDLRIENQNGAGIPSFFSFHLYGTNYVRNPYLANTLAILNNNLKLPVMVLTSDGRVGIGTDQPKAKFHVNGNIRVNSIVFSGANPDPAAVMPLFLDAHSVTQLNTAYKRYNQWDGGSDGLNKTKATASLGLKALAFTEALSCNDIGALPSANFTKANIVALGIPGQDTVLDETQVDNYVSNNGYFSAANFTKANIVALGIPAQDTVLNESQVDNFVANNGYFLAADFTKTDIVDLGIPSENTQLSTQNVAGMVESQPILNMIGTVKAVQFEGDGALLTGINHSQWTNNANDIYFNDGHVGIGTVAPDYKLTIQGTPSDVFNQLLHLHNTGTGGSGKASILLTDGMTGNTSADGVLLQVRGASSGFEIINQEDGPISLFTNGSEQVRLTAVGNVGIGTTVPTKKLEVNGEVKATGLSIDNININDNTIQNTSTTLFLTSVADMVFKIDSDNTQSNQNFYWQTDNRTLMVLKDDGKVGIGTESPVEKLDVSGNIKASGNLRATQIGIGTDTTAGTALRIRRDDADSKAILISNGRSSGKVSIEFCGGTNAWGVQPYAKISGVRDNPDNQYSNGDLTFLTTARLDAGLKERIRIKSDGNVGIGTTTPSTTLEVAGTVSANAFIGDGSQLTGIPSSPWEVVSGGIGYDEGNVGIGTTNPQAKLDITGQDETNQTALRINSDPGKIALSISPNGDFRIDKDGESGGRFIVNEAGNVGIGTQTPTEELDIAGDLYLSEKWESADGVTNKITMATHDGYNTELINNYNSVNPFEMKNQGMSFLNIKEGNSLHLHGYSYVALKTSGQERIRIKDNGDVGIGTTNPSSKLDVAGNFEVNDSDFFVDTLNGNVGIGIADPDVSTKVHIKNAGTHTYLRVDSGLNNAEAGIQLFANGSEKWSLVKKGSNDFAIYNHIDRYDFYIKDINGNVGIGTQTPAEELDIKGDLYLSEKWESVDGVTNKITMATHGGYNTELINNYNSVNPFEMKNQGVPFLNVKDSNSLHLHGYGYLVLSTSGQEKMRIDSAGIVGIGIADPDVSTKVHIKNAGTHTYLRVDSGLNNAEAGIQLFANGSEKWSLIKKGSNDFAIYNHIDRYDFYIKDINGNVGIGTQTPAEELDIKGDLYLSEKWESVDGVTNKITMATHGGYNTELINNYNSVNRFEMKNQGMSFLNIKEGNSLHLHGYSYVALKTSGQERIRIKDNGNVGIGETNPVHKLVVQGIISAQEVIVQSDANVADYVFEPDYDLLSLNEVETFVKKNRHLPNVPSEAEIKAGKGIKISEFQMKLLEKIEELTLYVIAQQKEINAQKTENQTLTSRLNQIEKNYTQGKETQNSGLAFWKR